MLVEHFGIKSGHLRTLEPAFDSRFMNPGRMMEEIVKLSEYCADNHTKIRNRAAYVTESLLRMFAEDRRAAD